MGKDLKGKELGLGLSQRRDGTYCARFTDKFGKRRSIYGKKLSEVKEKLLETEYEAKILNACIRDNITLDEWFEQWLLLFKNDTRETTKHIYKAHYESFISPTLGEWLLTSITQLEIRHLINTTQEKGYAWETLIKIKRILSDMYERAIASSLAIKNPARGIRINRKITAAEQRVILSSDEQELFLNEAMKSSYYNAYVVQLNTGLRAGELFALTEESIDFERKHIRVNKSLQFKCFDGKGKVMIGSTKTPSSNRIVPMNVNCENALRSQVIRKEQLNERYPDSEYAKYLFTTNRNNALSISCYNSSIKTVLNRLRAKGVEIGEISSHSLRHAFATRCFEANIHPKIVQKYLGHASIKMTLDIYTHISDELEMTSINKLNSII